MQSCAGARAIWFLSLCLTFLGLLNKLSQTRRLQQQKCIASHFWRLEVHNEGVGRAGSFRGP